MLLSEVFGVLISGAGQLGSRYLQGLVKCRLPLKIMVHDSSLVSLERARLRWNEVLDPHSIHTVSYHSSIETLPHQIDVVILATTADSRPIVIRDIATHASVRFWVVEKVLAQNQSGLDEIVKHIGVGFNAWVNTPRRMMPWHREIKAQLGLGRPMTLKVQGGAWRLACNAVHFLDLLEWWSGETISGMTTDLLAPHWFESERRGFWEIAGTLSATFSGGASAHLCANQSSNGVRLEVTDGRLTWLIAEADGIANRSDGLAIVGRMQYQSEMTAPLVESILEGRGCDLPTLEESARLHRTFIHGMLEHWKRAGNAGATAVPIT
jgi:hypothetical protein